MSVLSAGDGYYFPTTLPHKFRNIGADESEIISANTPPKLWLVSVRSVVGCE
jgi:mannose-6-phosphate isomerase-like protein (cupin superfamily)